MTMTWKDFSQYDFDWRLRKASYLGGVGNLGAPVNGDGLELGGHDKIREECEIT